MVKVLITTGDAAEGLEVMYPYQRLLEAGYTVHIAAPSKKVIQTVVHDFEPGWDTYTEKLGYRVNVDVAFAAVDPSQYAGLVLPGGRAPEFIRNDTSLQSIVRHFLSAGKPVAAICHAALILIALDSVKGRTLTAYPALQRDVEMAGGTFKDSDVVVDRNLVSSRAWPDHPAFMREFLKLLPPV
ncbi:MAG: DJ-1/PfpI family protein [bacterium]